jgi:Leucine-rich repeat (LRR) protein
MTCLYAYTPCTFDHYHVRYLNNNCIRSITALSSLTHLRVLDLSLNHLESLGGIEMLFCLESLNVSHNCLKSLDQIKACSRIQTLNASNNCLSENCLHAISKLSLLACLYLDGNEELSAMPDLHHKLVTNLPNLRFVDSTPIQPHRDTSNNKSLFDQCSEFVHTIRE